MDKNSDKRKTHTHTHTSHTLANACLPALTACCAVIPISLGCDKQNQFVTILLPKKKKVLLQGNANHKSLKEVVHLKKHFDSLSFFHKTAPLLFHGSFHLQLTVPLTCTDMRFILFIDNLLTLLLIVYVDILYILLLKRCFFGQMFLFFPTHVTFLMIGVSHCNKFTDG